MATWFVVWGSDEDLFWASGSLCFFLFQRRSSPNSVRTVLLFRSTIEQNNGKNKHQNQPLPLGTQMWSNTWEKGIQSLCGWPHLPPPPPVIITENDVFLSVSNSAICHIYHKITEWRAAIHGAAKSQTRLSDWTELKEWTGHERAPWLNFPWTFESPAYTTLSRMSPSPEFWWTRGSFFSREAYPISGQLSKENFIAL